jgi:diguanylate cyclase (GGDEF)-like protein
MFYGALVWIVAKLRLALEMEQLLSRTDFLTRMANRKAFLGLLDEQLVRLREQGGTLMIISVNLDRFASFNQEQGYTVGDLALGAVADLMRRKSSVADLLGRSDNSEFTIARTLASSQDYGPTATSLRNQLETLMLVRGWQLPFSLAIACFEVPPESAHFAMGKLRVLLEEARRLGRNRCMVRTWGPDGLVPGPSGHTAGPFEDFEATGQMFLDSGHRAL